LFLHFWCLTKGFDGAAAVANTSFTSNSLDYIQHLANGEIFHLTSSIIEVASNVRDLNIVDPNAFTVSLAVATVITVITVTIIKVRLHIVIAASG
jgi:hypothetical protein